MSSFISPSGSAELRDPSSDVRPDFSAFLKVVSAAACSLGCSGTKIVADMNAAWDVEHTARVEEWKARSASSNQPPTSFAANVELDGSQTNELHVQDPNSLFHVPYPKKNTRHTYWYGWRVTEDDLVRYAQPLYDGDFLALGGYERVRVAVKILAWESGIHHLRVELGYARSGATRKFCSVLTFCGNNIRDMETDLRWRPSNAQVKRINAWIGCGPQWFTAHR